MSNIEYLVGQQAIYGKPLIPFSDIACEFLHAVSSLLMKEGRQYPDVLSFAYWCRKANLTKMKSERTDLKDRIGRGLAFHIAPGNVPINFAFSFVFSLLAGNLNIVRVPSKAFPQVDVVCAALRDVFNDYPELKQSNAFVRYQSNDSQKTETFCNQADIRVIWGGDNTINTIKSMKAKPRCVDIAFADRYSLAIIDGKAVISANDDELKRLSVSFYNDTYLMDQNACSSPQLILWLNDSEDARKKFWYAVNTIAKDKYVLQSTIAVDKYTKLFENILDTDDVSKICYNDNYLYRVELKRLSPKVGCLRGKAGYFYEYPINSFDELNNIVEQRYQTITCYGINREELKEFVLKQRLSGIDRIVPVGSAMDIGVIWDGYDLIGTMSRIVALV